MHKILLGCILFQPVIFNPLSYKITVIPKITFTSLLVIFLLTLLVVKKKDNDKIYIAKNFLYIPLILYLLSLFFSTVFSIYSPKSTYYLFQILTYSLFFFLLVNIIKDKKDVEFFITIIIIASFFVSLYAILQALKIDIFYDVLRFPVSSIGFPSLLSAYLGVVFPFSLYRFIHSERKWLYFICVSFIISASVLALGRAGILSIILITILFLFTSKFRYFLIFLFVLLIFLFTVLFQAGKFETLAGEYVEKQKTVRVRLYLWEETLRGIDFKKPFGSGLNTYAEIYPKLRTTRIFPYWGYKILPDHTHNELLQTAITTGIFGVFCYFFLIISFALKMCTYFLKEKLVKAIFFSFIAYLIQSIFTPNIMDTNLLFFAVMGLGCIAAGNNKKYFEISINLTKTYRDIIFYIYAVIIVLLLIKIINPAVADIHFKKAKKYLHIRMYPESLNYFVKCLRFNNKDPLYHRDFAEFYEKLSDEVGSAKEKKYLLEKAIARYKILIKLNPLDASSYAALGRVYKIYAMRHNKEKFNLSIKYFKKAQQIDKNSVIFYNGLGDVYFEMQDFDNAERQFKKAIELAPQFTDAYYNLAIIYIKKDKLPDARRTLRAAPQDKKTKELLKYYEK